MHIVPENENWCKCQNGACAGQLNNLALYNQTHKDYIEHQHRCDKRSRKHIHRNRILRKHLRLMKGLVGKLLLMVVVFFTSLEPPYLSDREIMVERKHQYNSLNHQHVLHNLQAPSIRVQLSTNHDELEQNLKPCENLERQWLVLKIRGKDKSEIQWTEDHFDPDPVPRKFKSCLDHLLFLILIFWVFVHHLFKVLSWRPRRPRSRWSLNLWAVVLGLSLLDLLDLRRGTLRCFGLVGRWDNQPRGAVTIYLYTVGVGTAISQAVWSLAFTFVLHYRIKLNYKWLAS